MPFSPRALTPPEMRLLAGAEIRDRLKCGAPSVPVSFPFLRVIFGGWPSAEEFQAKVDAFAGEFGFAGRWDWDTSTHVEFITA
jgi:hypothetical protein